MCGDFGAALQVLKCGGRVTRRGWNGNRQPERIQYSDAGVTLDVESAETKFEPRMWLMLQVPDAHSKMTLPYVYIMTAQGDLVPWLCSQTDLLATDWFEVG